MTAFQASPGYAGADRGRVPDVLGGAEHLSAHAGRTPADKRIIVGYGFWIFLLSDIVMFSAFFATYAVLSGETAGGPSGKELFNLNNVAIETACLLLSSFTCGIASIGSKAFNGLMYYGGMAVTFVFGAGFLFFEIHELGALVAQGAGPDRSAFLSAFFALVGCHGVHVTLGLLVAPDHDGAGVRKGLSGRHPAPRPLLQPVLAHARHHLGRDLHGGLSDGSSPMSETNQHLPLDAGDTAPGDERAGGREVAEGIFGYLVGLALAILITVVAFFISGTSAGLGTQHPDRAGGAGDRADRRAPGLLHPHHHRAGQRQQHPGAGVRRLDRHARNRRVAVDHDQPEPQHDADADGIIDLL